MTENIQPFEYQKTTNLQEHNDIVNKINQMVDHVNANESDILDIASDIEGFNTRISTNESDIAINKSAIESNDIDIATLSSSVADHTSSINDLIIKVAPLFKSVDKIVGQNYVTLNFVTSDDTPYNLVMPIASDTLAGFMTSNMVSTINGYEQRISVLESQQSIYMLSLPNDTPTDQEITTAYTTTYPYAPGPPTGGTIVWDVNRQLKYVWNVSTTSWEQDTTGDIPIATNTTLGLVKGVTVTGNDGKIYLETDGSMSVIGWDALYNIVHNVLVKTLSITDNTTNGLEIKTMNNEGIQLSTKIIKNVKDSSATATENCLLSKNDMATKQDKNVSASNISIATGDWVNNTSYATLYSMGYIYECTIPVPGMTENLIPYITLDMTTYINGNVWQRVESLTNGIKCVSKTNDAMTVLTAIGMVKS